MPINATLSGSSKFEYTLDGLGGFFIEYTGRPHITEKLIKKIKKKFKSQNVLGGFNMTSPTPGGFGEWIKSNTSFTPRHASHIAAVLKELGIIKESKGKKPISLIF